VRAVAKSKRTIEIAIVAADFHAALTDAMLEAAADEATRTGVRIAHSVRVPGCYETPLVAEHVLARRDIEALVVLGCIERGETLHGEVMGHVVHRALVEASLRHDKPVGLGIIGPGATPKQAEARKDASARAAVRAVVRALDAIESVRSRRKR
jgi:6,7-dimethyl-8-ribityllumazine synthase